MNKPIDPTTIKDKKERLKYLRENKEALIQEKKDSIKYTDPLEVEVKIIKEEE
ncbi:hypothetical protein [Ekhidna sp.]|uniref:hypothetical protein n=1 Tax=Ekhidna sp. TaxID=2608089 RepID=UPI003C7B2D2A